MGNKGVSGLDQLTAAVTNNIILSHFRFLSFSFVLCMCFGSFCSLSRSVAEIKGAN